MNDLPPDREKIHTVIQPFPQKNHPDIFLIFDNLRHSHIGHESWIHYTSNTNQANRRYYDDKTFHSDILNYRNTDIRFL